MYTVGAQYVPVAVNSSWGTSLPGKGIRIQNVVNVLPDSSPSSLPLDIPQALPHPRVPGGPGLAHRHVVSGLHSF